MEAFAEEQSKLGMGGLLTFLWFVCCVGWGYQINGGGGGGGVLKRALAIAVDGRRKNVCAARVDAARG